MLDGRISGSGALMMGRACTNQGILLSKSGRNGEAAHILEEAIAVQQMLLEQNSRAVQFRHGLALALLHCGRVKVELGLPGSAEPALQEAFGLMQQLVKEFVKKDDLQIEQYRATRLLAAGYLGEALFRQGRTAAAAELLREAEKEGAEILGGPSKNSALRGHHARFLLALGCLEGEMGNLDRAVEVGLKAHEKLEQALRQAPGDRALRSDWLANREALARFRFLKGGLSRDGWIAEQHMILKERKDLVGHGPPASRFQAEVAGSAVVLAGLLLEAGRPAEALACVEGVLPAHEEVVRTEQDRVKAAAKEQKEGVQKILKARSREVGRLNFLQSMMRTRPVFPDKSLHRQWAALLARRGAALAQVGRGVEAVEAAGQAIDLTQGLLQGDYRWRCPLAAPESNWSFLALEIYCQEPCYQYDLACYLALASTLPGHAGRYDSVGRAVEALRGHRAAGFDNLHKLRTDPELGLLRKHDYFQKLVRDLELRGPGASPNDPGGATP